jgi:hypothetical protein
MFLGHLEDRVVPGSEAGRLCVRTKSAGSEARRVCECGDCDRTVIRRAQNLEEHRGLRTHTEGSLTGFSSIAAPLLLARRKPRRVNPVKLKCWKLLWRPTNGSVQTHTATPHESTTRNFERGGTRSPSPCGPAPSPFVCGSPHACSRAVGSSTRHPSGFPGRSGTSPVAREQGAATG